MAYKLIKKQARMQYFFFVIIVHTVDFLQMFLQQYIVKLFTYIEANKQKEFTFFMK